MKTSELKKKVAEREAKVIKYVEFVLGLFNDYPADVINGSVFPIKFGAGIDEDFRKLIFVKFRKLDAIEVRIIYPCPSYFMGLSVTIPFKHEKLNLHDCEVQIYNPVAMDGCQWEDILNSLIENKAVITQILQARLKGNKRRRQACQETALLKAKAKRLGL